MANREDDILRDAIIGTEKEIFGEAFGKEGTALDESGDRSNEQMGDGLEGQHEPEEDDDPGKDNGEIEGAKTEPEKEPAQALEKTKDGKEDLGKGKEPPKTEEPTGRVPPGRLREETRRAQTAEAALVEAKAKIAEAEALRKKDVDTLNAKVEALIAAVGKQQVGPQPPKAEVKDDKPAGPPDMFEDPKGFADYIANATKTQLEQMRGQMDAQRVESSLSFAHQKHGDQFTAAYEAVTKLDPRVQENKDLVQRLWGSPNPGEALVTWHRRNEALREVGDDPAAYKARILEDARKAALADPDIRKQLIEEMRAEAETGDSGRPRNVTRLPGSLNRTPGGNGRAPNDLEMFDGSEQAVFESAFK